MVLTSPRFNWNARLQMASDNNPPINPGDAGLHVRHIQQALIDLGHPLPKSVAKHGTVDGLFGGETKDKLKDFQRDQKKRFPSFSVDGGVGSQTMSAFDRLLRTPITLPPLATPGGATDPNANLVQSIINVLRHPELHRVNFSLMGVDVSAGNYGIVRRALEDGSITAEHHPMPANVRGFYLPRPALHKITGAVLIDANTFVLPFPRVTTDVHRITIVHEAVHAFCDIRAIGRPGTAAFTRDQSETVAHLAQATFHRAVHGRAEVDPLTSDLTKGLNPVFQKADELAQFVLGPGSLPSRVVGELHGLVRQNRLNLQTQQNIVLPNTTDFNGV